MSKRLDVETSLPRSWEIRYIRTVPWEQKTSTRLRWWQHAMDPLIDVNFNFRRLYRQLKGDYGYLAGPLVFGIPFSLFCFKGLRNYQTKLDLGKIQYQYRAPEHLRIPPNDLKQQPPWNSEYVAPLRKSETLSSWQTGLEQGSRMAPRELDPEFIQRVVTTPHWQTSLPQIQNHSHEAKPSNSKQVET